MNTIIINLYVFGIIILSILGIMCIIYLGYLIIRYEKYNGIDMILNKKNINNQLTIKDYIIKIDNKEYYKNFSDFYKVSEEELVQNIINKLIEALYIPEKEHSTILTIDDLRLKHFGIERNEPINWGNLKCTEVKKFSDNSFLVTIEEAEPKRCITFCNYIEEMMNSYGWKIRVETEW